MQQHAYLGDRPHGVIRFLPHKGRHGYRRRQSRRCTHFDGMSIGTDTLKTWVRRTRLKLGVA